MIQAYRLTGLKIESDLELPDLSPWKGPASSAPDVAFRLGKVPAGLRSPDRVEAIFQTRGRDEYLLTLEGTGRILIGHGREITLDLESGADLTNTKALLTGSMQAVLWHQRGLLPLHANAVVVDGRAVVLAGRPAIGKSALAATLCSDGYASLADDVCVIDAGAEAEPARVLPGIAVFRLWRDTLDDFGIGVEGLQPALSGKEKFFLPPPVECQEPRPLAAVVVLAGRARGAATIERLRGTAAIGALRDVIHMRRPAEALGRNSEMFATQTRLVHIGVTVWRLMVPHGPAGLREAAAKVVSVMRGQV
jgi:hypothetical protein